MKKETDKGQNPPRSFNNGHLAKVKRANRLREREMLSRTSLKDLMGKRISRAAVS